MTMEEINVSSDTLRMLYEDPSMLLSLIEDIEDLSNLYAPRHIPSLNEEFNIGFTIEVSSQDGVQVFCPYQLMPAFMFMVSGIYESMELDRILRNQPPEAYSLPDLELAWDFPEIVFNNQLHPEYLSRAFDRIQDLNNSWCHYFPEVSAMAADIKCIIHHNHQVFEVFSPALPFILTALQQLIINVHLTERFSAVGEFVIQLGWRL